MAEVLVLVELNPDGSGVRKTTLEALTAARALGEPSAVVIIGAPGIAAAGKDALAQYGAQKVYVAESDEIDSYRRPQGGGPGAAGGGETRPPSSSCPHRRARRSPAGWPSRRTPVS